MKLYIVKIYIDAKVSFEDSIPVVAEFKEDAESQAWLIAAGRYLDMNPVYSEIIHTYMVTGISIYDAVI